MGFLASSLLWILLHASLWSAMAAGPEGKSLFATHCAACHGLEGDGKGPEAGRFFTLPADLRKGVFKFRSTPTGSLPTDRDLASTIRRGLPGSGMMAQDHLSDREVREIIAYIKTLSPRWTHESVPPAISITAPMDLRALVGMGADLFKKAGCPECHGATGRGDGPSARSLTSGGRPTRPADLTVRPFKGGDQPEEIFRTLAVGIDGTPMPSYRDALEEREIWAISAYVESLARVGKRSAPTDDERVGHEIETRYQPGRRR